MRQTALLTRYADRVTQTVSRLRQERVVPRLWARDPSLWSADASVQASISKRLGWLTIAEAMSRWTGSLQSIAQEIRGAGLTHALLLGMGGSGLFSEVCRHTFGVPPAGGGLDLAVLDTTDPTAIRTHQRRCPPPQLLVIVSSKSGSTIEVTMLAKHFCGLVQSAAGGVGAHCVAITDAGTALEEQAKAMRFRRILTHGPGSGAEVGGRFSALTFFGLLPAVLIGANPDRLLERAEAMRARCGPQAAIEDNPAVTLGAALGTLVQEGRDKLTLVCAPALASVGTWVEQTVAESLGKQGRGMAPIHGEPLRDPGAYGQDRVFVELQLASDVDQAVDRHVQALVDEGQPVIRIHWTDRYDLGGEVMKWSLATAIAGHVMGINPFDEPNVQESKDRTKALLADYIRDGRFPPEEPMLADGDVTCFGRPGGGPAVGGTPPGVGGPARTLGEGLRAFLQQQRPGDYAAVLSFLPRTETLDRAVHDLRRTLAARLGAATMVGFGPRYLHSTGQLFKGGPDAGIFLLLTADEPEDLPIPGEPYTFGVLKQAQALGDFHAMQERGRRILRVHLRGALDGAAARLLGAVEEAAKAGAVRSTSLRTAS